MRILEAKQVRVSINLFFLSSFSYRLEEWGRGWEEKYSKPSLNRFQSLSFGKLPFNLPSKLSSPRPFNSYFPPQLKLDESANNSFANEAKRRTNGTRCSCSSGVFIGSVPLLTSKQSFIVTLEIYCNFFFVPRRLEASNWTPLNLNRTRVEGRGREGRRGKRGKLLCMLIDAEMKTCSFNTMKSNSMLLFPNRRAEPPLVGA